eukprot:COSAG01_NODE_1911_length_8925_cov_151.747111_14_plen_157_part_00
MIEAPCSRGPGASQWLGPTTAPQWMPPRARTHLGLLAGRPARRRHGGWVASTATSTCVSKGDDRAELDRAAACRPAALLLPPLLLLLLLRRWWRLLLRLRLCLPLALSLRLPRRPLRLRLCLQLGPQPQLVGAPFAVALDAVAQAANTSQGRAGWR